MSLLKDGGKLRFWRSEFRFEIGESGWEVVVWGPLGFDALVSMISELSKLEGLTARKVVSEKAILWL